ncbi:MAG: glutamine-hydrolyzing GMP synthase [Dehalococcoidia bacterium]|nr:glutamine-hydrolyzing GMP synthase [Dehalococcoidia bacterium]|tara:strand:+ start:250 stop:1920 length:1671 start_codon:yes stop_codon:yes gene_type:complete
MNEEQGLDSSRRITSSDDLEVSAYLEISQEKAGHGPATEGDMSPQRESILIVDFGSQYSRLIARRVRENSVYCEIISFNTNWSEVEGLNPKGIILSGGPASVYDETSPLAPLWVFESGLPILGICYGMQVLVHQLGGKVSASTKKEYGHAVLHQNKPDEPLFTGLPQSLPVWMSHADQVTELPPGFVSMAHTDNSPIAVVGNDKGILGIQFHPEVAHTPQGSNIIENFLTKTCNMGQTWTPDNFVVDSVNMIREQVGKGKVICALSGGVDSAVAATLVHKAVGDQLTCIFVNNGLMRRGEPDRVRETFEKYMDINLIFSESTERFLTGLAGVIDPERKRKIIGEEFINVFDEEASKLGVVDFLTQGTLYPDVIESKTSDNSVSATIKTHHNVGGLPDHMKMELVEPLRYLFKDEVRQVGLELGLPEEMVFRQPFPGPGLAIRIMGEVTSEKLEILRAADWIVMDEIKANGLYNELWQTFAVLTGSRSVGVTGDFRTYGHVIAIRAVKSDDAMTADWARLPYDVLASISSRISNEVSDVNRVVFDITSKPPGTIEWE